MNEVLFEAQIKYTQAACTESCKKIYAPIRAVYLILFIITVLYMSWSVIRNGVLVLLPILLLSIAVVIFLFFMPMLLAGRMLRRQQLINNAPEPIESIWFYQDYFEAQAENGGVSKFSYPNIGRILETKHLFILKIKPNLVQLIDQATFSQGTASEFKDFLCHKTKAQNCK